MQNTPKNTEKLLSITNLKKYFPVGKSSIFQKNQLYVRANEEITLDIYKGETLGIVGESGCGKSTLGRVILQLYEQTAGTTMFYGYTLAEISPSYVRKTLSHAEKYVAKIHSAYAKAEALTKRCDGLGANASFFDLQTKNLAIADYETALSHVAKILGGFVVKDTKAGAALLMERSKREHEIVELQKSIVNIKNEIEVLEAEENPKKKAKVPAKIAALGKKASAIEGTIAKYENEICEVSAKIDALKEKHAGDAEFAKYEAMLDDGIDLARLKYSEMRLLRKDLQIIFQDPYSSLNPRMTIGQIIEEGLVTHNYYKHGSPKMKEYILETMRRCGLQDYMMHRYPHQFSGGQRQRISIARALAVKPKFIVCDECVSALDVSIQSQIINLLQELKEKENLTYMFISHDLSVVRYISDRICVMYLGNIVELASAQTIFEDPRHPYTVALLSSIPTTDAESLKKERILLEGNIPSPIRPPEGCKFHTRCYMACDKCKRVPPPLAEVEPGHFVACHFPEKKLDENGDYLFDVPKTLKNGK